MSQNWNDKLPEIGNETTSQESNDTLVNLIDEILEKVDIGLKFAISEECRLPERFKHQWKVRDTYENPNELIVMVID
jgi:hypothetical protein